MRALRVAAAISLVTATLMMAPTSTAHAASSGCATTVINGVSFRCTFDEEFSTNSLNRTRWVPQTQFLTGDPAAGQACMVDDPSNVSVSNGALHLTVHRLAQPMTCRGTSVNYSSGQVSTYRRFSQAYGRFEARMRTTATTSPGLQEAFWLWPDDRYVSLNWPTTGEIDVAETYSLYPNLAVPYLHYTANDNGGPIPGTNTAWDCAAPRGVWNTYTLQWSPSSLSIYVNGKLCLVNTSGDPAFTERYIVVLTQALGMGQNATTTGTPIPATSDVDYVRVWQSR